ncbi:LPS export ABC transporter permease LptG [Oceaniferula spumae]|uniref:LPS export ABC transporter permease LptG n=1 Tax=Oceaniferula spumae TaxID=2979115 RepID=A0AAT9FR56_9BACT
MAGASTVRSYLWPVLLTVLGGFLCTQIVPREIIAVNEHILGFPDTDISGHKLRPYLLGVLCMLPAIAAWIYRFSGILDRYMARQFLTSFALCMSALLAVMLLTDLQNNFSDFRDTENPMDVVISYYSILIPAVFVFLLPYVLLLALLYCLGKMSRHQEIVAMIQTGRGVFRIVLPLLFTGVFCSVVCLIFNYHWGPWSEGNKDLIIDVAKDGQADRARSVLYRDSDSRRVWLVGAFPYQFEKTGTLRNVTIREFNSGGHPTKKLEADVAQWSRVDKNWTFTGVQLIDLQASPVPIRIKTGDTVTRTWHETPWQLVKPGLDHTHLGIPDLNSWLRANEGIEWANRSPYLTQWHYRFAQPVICLITILIAAPLGIVFSRRGIGGGVAIALFLCVGMLFSSTFFLTFGEAGHMPPALSAWATNILFAVIALYLFNRRMAGRPIYQSLKKLLPSGE